MSCDCCYIAVHTILYDDVLCVRLWPLYQSICVQVAAITATDPAIRGEVNAWMAANVSSSIIELLCLSSAKRRDHGLLSALPALSEAYGARHLTCFPCLTWLTELRFALPSALPCPR